MIVSDSPSPSASSGRKIAVVGTGYVGISNAVLLAQRNRVVALDIDANKVDLLTARRSPISDAEIEDYLAKRQPDLVATTDKRVAYAGADVAIKCEEDWLGKGGVRTCR